MGQEKKRDIHMKRGISKINVGKGQENVGYAEEIYGIDIGNGDALFSGARDTTVGKEPVEN